MDNQHFDRNSLGPITKWWIDIDKINVMIIFAIIVFGLMMTATSSTAIAKRIDVTKFFFLNKQIIFACMALFLLVVISFLDQEYIKFFAIVGLTITILLLIAVLFFGLEAKGAKRWIYLAGFTLQPSEFAKTFFIIVNAYVLQKYHNSIFFS